MTVPFGGYTCGACGGWVQNGFGHTCFRFYPQPAPAPAPIPVTFITGITEERVREIVREELAAHPLTEPLDNGPT